MELLYFVIPLIITASAIFIQRRMEYGKEYFGKGKPVKVIYLFGLVVSAAGYIGILRLSNGAYNNVLYYWKSAYCIGCAISLYAAASLTAAAVYVHKCEKKGIAPERYIFPYINMGTKKFLQTFKDGNADTRGYFKRAAILFVPAAAVMFMTGMLGTSEVFFANLNEWNFLFDDYFIPALVYTFAGLFIISFLIPVIIKGKNLDRLAIFISSAAVMSYIQYAFLNSDELIKGGAQDIFDSFGRCFADLLLWMAAVMIPQLMYKGSEGKLKKISLCASAFLLLIQLPSVIYLISEAPDSAFDYSDEKIYDITGEGQYELSSDENIVVFIMDAYYEGVFETLLSEEPDYYKEYSDFTFYNNVNSCVQETAFSIPHMLTATDTDLSLKLMESNRNAWNSDKANSFYDALHNDGYIVKLYTDSADYCGGAENMRGKIDNILGYTASYVSDRPMVFLKMLQLSVYKYSPDVFKNFFLVDYAGEVNKYSTLISEYETVENDNWKAVTQSALDRGIRFTNYDYYDGLTATGLSVRDDKKVCVFQHINGMHRAYQSLDSSQGEVSEGEAQEACLTIFSEYLSQMKELGIYDNSLIILTADHGYDVFGMNNPIFLIKRPGEHKDSLDVNSAPGDIQKDLLATIAHCAGIECDGLGTSVTELDENMQRERIRRWYAYTGAYPPAYKINGVGEAFINICQEYTFTGRELEDMDSEYTAYPVIDYWW